MNYKVSIVLLAALTGVAFADIVKLSTKNLAGLHCITDMIYNLEDLTGNLQYDLKLCGNDAATTMSYVHDNAHDVLHISAKIIHLNNEVCNNSSYDDDKDAKKATSQLCANSVGKQITKLKKAIRATVREINSVKSNDGCITLNLATLKLGFNDFDRLVRQCADVARKA